MSEDRQGTAVDLIRWTFTIDPARKADVLAYLAEVGLDAAVAEDGRATVLWDEPEPGAEADAIIDGLWEAHGSPIEVTHEEFARLNLLAYHADDEGDGAQAAA